VRRHELAVLGRQIPRPRLDERDRVFLAAASRLLGRGADRRLSFARTYCWAGIASSCGGGGRMPDGDPIDRRSPRRCVSWCCSLRVRTRAGVTSGSSASSPVSASASRQRRSSRSSDKQGCPPLALAPRLARVPAWSRRVDHRLRFLYGRDALAWSALCALLPRTRQPARAPRGCTANPDGRWTAEQARQLAWSLSGERHGPAS
jgi:hypothetical protein